MSSLENIWKESNGMITEGGFFPCDHCEHNGDCERGFDCPQLEYYSITKRNL